MKSFGGSVPLSKHVSLAHKEERPGKYKCEYCSLSYCSQSHLNRHKNKVHTDTKKFMTKDKRRGLKNKSETSCYDSRKQKIITEMAVESLGEESEDESQTMQVRRQIVVRKRNKREDALTENEEECSTTVKRQKTMVVQERKQGISDVVKEDDPQTDTSSESTEDETDGSQSGTEDRGHDEKGDDSEVSSIAYVSDN